MPGRFKASGVHQAPPQLFAAVAALQHLCNGADNLHVSPPPMWPLLLHAAMTHPMGTRAEIAAADPMDHKFAQHCVTAIFDKNSAVAICGMKAFKALLKRMPSACPTSSLVDVTMLVSRYVTPSNEQHNAKLQHSAVELLASIFALNERPGVPSYWRCLPALLHLAMNDATHTSVRRSCVAALRTAGRVIESCRAWLQDEKNFVQLVQLMDSQSCDAAVRADAMGVVLQLSCACHERMVPTYLAVFSDRLRPSKDAMSTAVALWGLFLQLRAKSSPQPPPANTAPNQLAVDACMARCDQMRSILDNGNASWVEPTLKIFHRVLILSLPEGKMLLTPAAAARIIAFIQHPKEALRFAALQVIEAALPFLPEALLSNLFVALRGCLALQPAVPLDGENAPSCDEDLVRKAVGRVHPPAVAFARDQIKAAALRVAATALVPSTAHRARSALDAGLFSALLHYRIHGPEEMTDHRGCIDAIVRGVDAAVDTVDEVTWASFLAYVDGPFADQSGHSAKLAVVVINATRGPRQWDVIIALHKALRLMRNFHCLHHPSNLVNASLQLLALDDIAPPHVIVATLSLLPQVLEKDSALHAGTAAQYTTRLLRHAEPTIRVAVLRMTPKLMQTHTTFLHRAVNLGLLDLISECPANEDTEIRDETVRCLAQLCSHRKDYSAALLTPRVLALLAATAIRSGPAGLNADAVANEAFGALCMLHTTESDREACCTLEPRETYLALVEMAAILCTTSRDRHISANTQLLCEGALKSGAFDAAQVVLQTFADHSGKFPFPVNGDVLLSTGRYCGYSGYECIRTAALGALATATANSTESAPHLRSLFTKLTATLQRRVTREELRDVLRCAKNLLVTADAPAIAVSMGLFRRLCTLYREEIADDGPTAAAAAFDPENIMAFVVCILTCITRDGALLAVPLIDAGCAHVIIGTTHDGSATDDVCRVVEELMKVTNAARAWLANVGQEGTATLVQTIVRTLAARPPSGTGVSPARRIIALLKNSLAEVALPAWRALNDALRQMHASRGASGPCPRDLAAAVAATDDLFSAPTSSHPDAVPVVLQLVRTVLKVDLLPTAEGTAALWKRLLAHESVAIRVEVLEAVVKHKADAWAGLCPCNDVILNQCALAAVTRLCSQQVGAGPSEQTQHEVYLALTCLGQSASPALMAWMSPLLTYPAMAKAPRIAVLQFVKCRWLSDDQEVNQSWLSTAAAVASLARPSAKGCEEEVVEAALQCIIAAFNRCAAETTERSANILRLLLEARCASALATRSTDPTAAAVAAELERQTAECGMDEERRTAVKALLRCGVSAHVAVHSLPEVIPDHSDASLPKVSLGRAVGPSPHSLFKPGVGKGKASRSKTT
jgi:hypothetical protein